MRCVGESSIGFQTQTEGISANTTEQYWRKIAVFALNSTSGNLVFGRLRSINSHIPITRVPKWCRTKRMKSSIDNPTVSGLGGKDNLFRSLKAIYRAWMSQEPRDQTFLASQQSAPQHHVDELRQTDLARNLYSLENRMRRSNRPSNVEQMNDRE